tara:strand:+ start:176 stop:1057 length:882 start_codon:yes stop_codon:yes gene_type:complete
MSRLRANQITNENANGSPNFPHGLTVTGIVTASSLNSTATQIVAGAAVTANSGGVDTVGIVTASSYRGDGSQLTGIDASTLKNGSDVKVQANASGAVVTGVLTTTSYRPGEIIETLTGHCDGRTLVGLSTSITLSNITAIQNINSNTYADITGSTISYIPPIGTKTLIYRFMFHKGANQSSSGINHFKILIDGTEISYSRRTYSNDHNSAHNHMHVPMDWTFKLDASSTSAANGYYTTADWVTAQQAKTIKVQGRRYSSDYNGVVHFNRYWDGATAAGSNQVVQPSIFIQAIG